MQFVSLEVHTICFGLTVSIRFFIPVEGIITKSNIPSPLVPMSFLFDGIYTNHTSFIIIKMKSIFIIIIISIFYLYGIVIYFLI